MVTTREFMNVASSHGRELPYRELRDVMRLYNIRPQTRVVNGMPIRAYLTSQDCACLIRHFEIPIASRRY